MLGGVGGPSLLSVGARLCVVDDVMLSWVACFWSHGLLASRLCPWVCSSWGSEVDCSAGGWSDLLGLPPTPPMCLIQGRWFDAAEVVCRVWGRSPLSAGLPVGGHLPVGWRAGLLPWGLAVLLV